MDPYATFGAPLLGAMFNVLISMGWEAAKKLKSGRRKEPIPAPDSSVLRGTLGPLLMNEDTAKMTQVSQDLAFLNENYSDLEQLNPDDEALITTLLRLRGNLEVVFGQRITFQGEDDRARSGTHVAVDHEFKKTVNTKITGAKTRLPESGAVRAVFGEVHGGEIIGFDGSEK